MKNRQLCSFADRSFSANEADHGTAAILSFGTAVPAHGLCQAEIGEWMAGAFIEQPAVRRAVRILHAQSGIETRYSCCPEYLQPTEYSRFAPNGLHGSPPTTAVRMAIYAREAPILGIAAAHKALTAFAETVGSPLRAVADSVTHLVVVSCTGFFAPGLDFVIAQKLGLAATVSRTLIGFMGCSAAFNGLRTAHQIVRSQPNARVLVVCVELCSLHIQQNSNPAHLIAMSLFADGAAACLVGQAAPEQTGIFHLEAFHTETQPGTASEMVWEIGDHGFVLHLSPKIPEHVANAAPATLNQLFLGQRPDFWAIHPGGRAIVDRLQEIFGLTPSQVAASRAILRRYGNLSSATILFVLAELQQTLARRTPPQHSRCAPQRNDQNVNASGVAMAFGPGLVIEMARLTYVAAPLSGQRL